jgi:hypothetical protein
MNKKVYTTNTELMIQVCIDLTGYNPFLLSKLIRSVCSKKDRISPELLLPLCIQKHILSAQHSNKSPIFGIALKTNESHRVYVEICNSLSII